jgi:hypothetical protein
MREERSVMFNMLTGLNLILYSIAYTGRIPLRDVWYYGEKDWKREKVELRI